jgi:hypothetical protein
MGGRGAADDAGRGAARGMRSAPTRDAEAPRNPET